MVPAKVGVYLQRYVYLQKRRAQDEVKVNLNALQAECLLSIKTASLVVSRCVLMQFSQVM